VLIRTVSGGGTAISWPGWPAATAWPRACAGGWAAQAADVARRSPQRYPDNA
jgi:hypothetical protein